MSIETWGQMPKSQESDQTIEERVAEMIAEHEADPEAHLGAGESIEVHRTQTTLDHPQGSVVADKRQLSQLELLTSFESIDGWTVNAASSFHEFGNFGIRTNSTLNNLAEAWLEDGVPVLCEEFHKNVMFQAVFDFIGIGSGTFNLNLSLLGEIDNYLGLGFRVTGLALTGLFNDGETLHTVSLGNLEKYKTYVVRAFANQGTGNVEFWVNGVLLGTVPFEQHYTSDETLSPYFSAKNTEAGNDVELFVNQLLIARDF